MTHPSTPRAENTTDDDPEPPPTATSTSPPVILVSDAAGVRTITLNRPAAFNSFNLALKGALLAALDDAATEPTVRAVVITGAGRAFCAGQDLKEHLALVSPGIRGWRRRCRSSTTRWSSR